MDAKIDENKLSTRVPLPVRRALYKLGRDIRDARLRRRIATAIMAQRASISRTTLNKVEKGDPGVSLGNYAAVLFVLGLSDRLSTLADVRSDAVGLELDEENLPRRIRRQTRGMRFTSGRRQPK
jgi:DNA-binding XRE family transcriptional regulator